MSSDFRFKGRFIAVKFMLVAVQLVIGVITSYSQSSKNIFGIYRSSSREIQLHKDSSFTYRYNSHLQSDSTSGHFTIINDTICLHYTKHSAVYPASNINSGMTILAFPQEYNSSTASRPQKLLLGSRKLYYLYADHLEEMIRQTGKKANRSYLNWVAASK